MRPLETVKRSFAGCLTWVGKLPHQLSLCHACSKLTLLTAERPCKSAVSCSNATRSVVACK